MQAIQLHATPEYDYYIPDTDALHMAAAQKNTSADLDDALALVLHAIRQSKNAKVMDALGTLLAYMENLENQQRLTPVADQWVTLEKPITMSV